MGISGGQEVGPLPVVEGLQADGSRCKEHRLTKAGGVTQTQGKHAGQAQPHHLRTDARVRSSCASKGPGVPLPGPGDLGRCGMGYSCWLNLKWTDPIRCEQIRALNACQGSKGTESHTYSSEKG